MNDARASPDTGPSEPVVSDFGFSGSSSPADANRQYLLAWLERIRHAIADYAEEDLGPLPASTPLPLSEREHSDSPLDVLCDCFQLSPFERDLLLMCAGVELDGEFRRICEKAGGASFGLGLAALSDPHWDALTPTASLRYWRLVELGPGNTLTASPLRIDERILHYLVGVSHLDQRLDQLGELVMPNQHLARRQTMLAEEIAGIWLQSDSGWLPAIQLIERTAGDARQIAAHAARRTGQQLMVVSTAVLPTSPTEMEILIRLWRREAALSNLALFVQVDQGEVRDHASMSRLTQVLNRLPGPVLVASSHHHLATQRPVVLIEVPAPTREEQRQWWRLHLAGQATMSEHAIEEVVGQFRFGDGEIRAISARLAARIALDGSDQRADQLLWDACRSQTRLSFDGLAEQIEPRAQWEDLIVPDEIRDVLREIVVHVRQRIMVHEQWGFAAKSGRGLGVSALFAGPSGTGKTMAAEVLSAELGLDLFRIDLSAVVSKYIGETEKNLRRVFDAAEDGTAILLFDEADALFGKRSEVKDSHDRYANIEVSYLLQRMESYEGLAILTSNLREAFDPAFVRRIRFMATFPFPGVSQREQIWRRVFPDQAPTDQLDWQRLARLNVSGGNIRSIALAAALLASEAEEPIGMQHLLRAARREYTKLNKPLSPSETEGWERPARVQPETSGAAGKGGDA